MQATEALSNAITAICNEKAYVEDYPCKDIPCEYWWVRYAVACTYLKESHAKLWQPKMDELKEKYGVSLFASQGCFDYDKCLKNKKMFKLFTERRIIISWVNQYGERQERAMTETSNDGELFTIFDKYLKEADKIEWTDCPYEQDKQSACPFYKGSEFYKLRKKMEAQINCVDSTKGERHV